MTENRTNGARWKLVSYTAGLVIVTAVLVLLFIAELTRRPVDWMTADLLLLIAAYLLGAPSIVSLFKRPNGNESG